MVLSNSQNQRLLQAINGYSFPPDLYDFNLDRPDPQPNTRAVEGRIKADLICGDKDRVKNGLSNVLYWGFSQMGGIREERVSEYRRNVTPTQLEDATKLFQSTMSPSLSAIGEIRLPQFSGVSFVSKICMFLDPENRATLDRQIMKMHASRPDTVLANVRMYKTQIPITAQNDRAYELWCRKMRDISTQYFSGRFRAADIERGFFQLVQDNEVILAGEILGSV